MRSRKALTVLLAVVAPMFFVDVAQAYYTPGLGRFISRDPYYELGERTSVLTWTQRVSFRLYPMGDARSSGLEADPYGYHYTRSNPTNLVDPLGLQETQPADGSGTKVAIECSAVQRNVLGIPVTIGYHCSVVATCGGSGFRWEDYGWARPNAGVGGDLDPSNPENGRKGETPVGGTFLDDPKNKSWKRYQVKCRKEECQCDLLRCFSDAIRRAGFVTYHPLGPNSNTFAHALLGKCGCSLVPVYHHSELGGEWHDEPDWAWGWNDKPPDYWGGWNSTCGGGSSQ